MPPPSLSRPHILFLLPAYFGVSCGGPKMVYQYANALVADGFQVTICYSWLPLSGSFRAKLYPMIRTLYHFIRGWTRHCNWFPVDRRVRQRLVWSLTPRWLPRADIVIATACQTAFPLARLRTVHDSQKFYLIQGYETFAMPEEQLLATYHLPLQKLVISSWLRDKVEAAGSTARLLPNGYDATFQRTCPPEQRSNASLSAMWGQGWNKDWPTTLKTLLLVRQAHPSLKAMVFGTGPRPADLPEWATYVRTTSQEQLNSIYNSTAIFIGTSIQEGWGLPVGEAMRCGTAVVCTDNGGYAEMAIPGKTALVVPVGDSAAMAAAVNFLIDNPAERIRLAQAGHTYIQQFTLGKSASLLESYLVSALPRP